MKLSLQSNGRPGGFTLSDTMVALGMFSVLGVCVYQFFLNGFILYAKNTAENVAHDQGRIAVNRLVHDIHAAVSAPQVGYMVNGNLAANPTAPKGSWTPYGTAKTFWADNTAAATNGTGFAGISFKKMGTVTNPNGGPFTLKNDPGNSDLIMIESGTDNPPTLGMEVTFPYYNLEGVIYKIESNGTNHWNIWIEGGLESRIKEKNGTYTICYYTTRYAYVVENGNLNFYSTSVPPTGVTWPVTIARNIINPSDRTQPAKPFSQTTPEYVKIDLTTEDNRYTNRNYRAVNTLLAGSVPIRAKLSVAQ
jgi:hypothetical protein